MNDVVIRDFEAGDFVRLGLLSSPLLNARDALASSLSKTAVLYGEPILSAGIFPMWEGVGEAWTAISDKAREHPFFLHRIVKQYLEIWLPRFHRVQMHALASDEVANRWPLSLGFKFEGTVHAYTPGAHDMNLYAIWRK